MKIQFIICGWWYDEFDGRKGITDFIDGLIELQKDNEFIDVFWSCHKQPTQLVKDNFKYNLKTLDWNGELTIKHSII